MNGVRWAERANGSRASEDRIFMGDRFAIVLDGASSLEPAGRNGGWLAETLGREVHASLSADRETPLSDAVAACIAAVAATHQLVPGASPSTTLAIARWDSATVEIFVLGDSPAAIELTDGRVELVRDDRLDQVAIPERQAHRAAATRGGFRTSPLAEWQALVAAQKLARNRQGGYWIGEANPEAAHHAIQRAWPIQHVAGVLLVTDGVAAGPDIYGTPPTWAEAVAIARRDPADLVSTVQAAEENDPDGQRWPRSKRHDDKASVFIDLRATFPL